jgi:hypothetical protein
MSDDNSDDNNSDDQNRNPLWKNDEDVVPKTLKSRKYYTPSVLQQKVQCHLCDQVFKRNSILFQHQRNHHAEYWAGRPTPGKGFKRGGWLDKDKLLCNICEDYKTSKIEEMDAHYENEHPDFWQMKLQNNAGWRGSLVRLKLSSMPEICYDEDADIFTCTICSKQFKKGNQMVAHVERVHKKMLNYQCDVCGNKFATPTNLKKHSFTHTKNYPFNCAHCNKGFPSEFKYMQEHCKKHHPEEFQMWLANREHQKNLKKLLKS